MILTRHECRHNGKKLALIAALLLVPNLAPQCNETEPNDTTGSASFIKPNEAGNGSISPAGDVDVWRAAGAKTGDVVFAYVQGSAGSDASLHILANDGSTFALDDDSGPDANPAIGGAIVPDDGDVYYQVEGFDILNPIPQYLLHQAILSPLDTDSESEPNGSSATANSISAGMMSGSVVALSGDEDFFRFSADAGATIAVIVDEEPDDLTDTAVSIIDTDGTTVLANGDNDPLNESNAAGPIMLANSGTHFIRVKNGGGDEDDEYRFVLFVNGVVYRDVEGDGVPQPDDNCPGNINPTQDDADGDGVGDVCDSCPAGVLKRAAGVCGCDQPDIDINNDGIIDCGLADPARALLTRSGLLLVPDQNNNKVLAFNPQDGDLVDANFIPSDVVHLPAPVAAILSPDHISILVSDLVLDVVQRFDLDGNFLGTFAPAGGANTAVLDEPSGIAVAPDGGILVCVGAGTNGNAVAKFDGNGNYTGNFIANGAGGLSAPTDLVFRKNGQVLVTSTAGAIKEYDSNGGYLADFAACSNDPQQVFEKSNGQVLVAFQSNQQRGVVEFQSNGAFVAQLSPALFGQFEGVNVLQNGHYLVATGARVVTRGTSGFSSQGGMFEMDASGNVLQNGIAGGHYSFIKFAIIDTDGDGIGDDLDGCPNDFTKTSPGQCGCGQTDTDSDGDGVANCDDGCPDDPAKQAPGPCGCGVPDVDTNSNGTADCLDSEPVVDDCPDDPDKLTPGECGCGVADVDADANGTADCNDIAAPSPDAGGCGACGAGTASMMPLLLVGLMLCRPTWRARRRGIGAPDRSRL
jgi:hypothetical protein